MSLVAWIVFGLIAGLIASRLVRHQGSGVVRDVLLGIVGAVVGGMLFNSVGIAGVSGFNLWSLVVAVLGSTIVLAAYYAVLGRRAA